MEDSSDVNIPKHKAMEDLRREYEVLRDLYYKLLERHAAAQNFIDKVRIHFASTSTGTANADLHQNKALHKFLAPNVDKPEDFDSLSVFQRLADNFFNSQKQENVSIASESQNVSQDTTETNSLNEESSNFRLLEKDAFSDSQESFNTLMDFNSSQSLSIENLSEEEQLLILSEALQRTRTVAEELQIQSLLLVKKVAKLC